MRTRNLVGWALAAALALVGTPSLAQPRDAAAADTLFRQGREAMKAGDYATACPKFEESQRLDPAAGTVLNLAQCEDQQGKFASAQQHYREAMETLPQGDPRVEVAEAGMASVEKKVPKPAPPPDSSRSASVPSAGPQNVGSEVAALPREKGSHEHNGSFLRLALGGGGIRSSASHKSTSAPGSVIDLAFGGIVAGNLAIHGSIFGRVQSASSGSDTRFSATGIGAGATYYFMPVNIYLSGAVGSGTMTGGGVSRTGVATNWLLGKEWWVSKEWGIGVAGQFMYMRPPGGETLGGGLLLSATYN